MLAVPAVFTVIQSDEVSVTQHLQYEMSKFAIALPWLLLRSILRHILLLVPSLVSCDTTSYATVCASDSVLVVDYARK